MLMRPKKAGDNKYFMENIVYLEILPTQIIA